MNDFVGKEPADTIDEQSHHDTVNAEKRHCRFLLGTSFSTDGIHLDIHMFDRSQPPLKERQTQSLDFTKTLASIGSKARFKDSHKHGDTIPGKFYKLYEKKPWRVAVTGLDENMGSLACFSATGTVNQKDLQVRVARKAGVSCLVKTKALKQPEFKFVHLQNAGKNRQTFAADLFPQDNVQSANLIRQDAVQDEEQATILATLQKLCKEGETIPNRIEQQLQSPTTPEHNVFALERTLERQVDAAGNIESLQDQVNRTKRAINALYSYYNPKAKVIERRQLKVATQAGKSAHSLTPTLN